jgi:hypothetical protein
MVIEVYTTIELTHRYENSSFLTHRAKRSGFLYSF